MSYISLDFACSECGNIFNELIQRDQREGAVLDCPACLTEATCSETVSAPTVMRAAYPDGTNRFAGLKESRRLTQAAAKAKKEGNFSEERRIKSERNKITKRG